MGAAGCAGRRAPPFFERGELIDEVVHEKFTNTRFRQFQDNFRNFVKIFVDLEDFSKFRTLSRHSDNIEENGGEICWEKNFSKEITKN